LEKRKTNYGNDKKKSREVKRKVKEEGRKRQRWYEGDGRKN